MKRQLLLLIPVLSIFLFSCDELTGKRVRGNGHISTRTEEVSDFKNVEVSGNVDLYLSQGATTPVKIEADDNLLEYIQVVQHGSTIEIKTRKGYNLDPSDKIKAYVSAAVYNKIGASGASNINSSAKLNNPEKMTIDVSGAGAINLDVDAPEVETDISGAGNINIKGNTKKFRLELTGAASAKCYEMLSEETVVDISGAGSAEVYASTKLDATLSGAGSVNYKGGATNVSQHVSGIGSIKKAD